MIYRRMSKISRKGEAADLRICPSGQTILSLKVLVLSVYFSFLNCVALYVADHGIPE